jgi:glyoxylase-like metal-dependent hydrolase (beta-lactamase superfamily II)|tara:strand:+ start:1456 stop:2466 length:1011 start_codon:yes stop_codon:yes gene_type:complete
MHRYTLILITCLGSGFLHAANPVTTDTHRFTEVRNGIYLAQTTARLFNSNSLVVVNDTDVVVVDSHVTPSKARDLVKSIKAITSNPISSLINSHHHWDHAHGNQVFTDVPIIGHEFTYMKLATAPLDEPTYTRGVTGNAAGITRLTEMIAAEQDVAKRSELETRLAIFSAHVKDFDEIDPVPPTVTMRDRMTLYRGDREIQIIFLGRAHTGGDVVVYFPQDKLVFTGDIAFGGPSFLGDGFVDEWPQTLENLKALDFDIFVPGHGGPVTDLRRIDLVQDYYRDLWKKTSAKYSSGVGAQEAAKSIDMRNHSEIPIRNVGVDPLAIQRIYDRLNHPD